MEHFLQIRILREEKKLPYSEISEPGLIIFCFYFCLLYLTCRYLSYYTWDEFSHWGFFTKELVSTNALINSESALACKNYPPGAPVFHYFITSIVGYSEGLVLGLAEEMNCGIPVIATKERGHKELIDHGVNGYLYDIDNKDQFIGFVKVLYADVEKRITFGRNAKEKAKKFHISNSLNYMQEIYDEWV